MDAAARKNCSQYASQCHEPDKLEYHCVLNPYINETLEVCAYPVKIVKGKLNQCIKAQILPTRDSRSAR